MILRADRQSEMTLTSTTEVSRSRNILFLFFFIQPKHRECAVYTMIPVSIDVEHARRWLRVAKNNIYFIEESITLTIQPSREQISVFFCHLIHF